MVPQTITEAKPAITGTYSSCCGISSETIIPSPIVLATAKPVAAPTILNMTAIMTAFRGESAREPIEAAMALAASLKPLTTPKPTAKMIITRRSHIEESGILEGYPLKDIRHILKPINLHTTGEHLL